MSYASGNCDTQSFKPQFNVLDQKKVYSDLESYACEESEIYSKEKCSVLKRNDSVVSSLRPYVCDECKKSFSTKAYLKIHTNVHSTSRPYICGECKKSFKRKAHLQIHKRYVHSIVELYVCNECKKSLKTNRHLKRHIKTVHSTARPYTCDECKKSFKQKGNLIKHKKIVHSIVKPYVCNECKKSFKSNDYLRNHKKVVHTTSRPYTCDECKKSFKEKGNLLRHKRTVHTALKPYVCDECKKAFNQKSNLLQHKKIHSRSRLYAHDKCEQYELESQLKNIIDYHSEHHNVGESNQKELNLPDFSTNVDSNSSVILINDEEPANISCIQEQTTDESNRRCNINENNAESEIFFTDLNEILRQFDSDSQTEINLLDEELFSQTLSSLSFE